MTMKSSVAAVRGVIAATAAAWDLPHHRLIGPERTTRLTHARFASVWIARQALGASWRAIGAQLGERDHTTIIHAHRRAEILRAADPAFAATTDRLSASFRSEHADG